MKMDCWMELNGAARKYQTTSVHLIKCVYLILVFSVIIVVYGHVFSKFTRLIVL